MRKWQNLAAPDDPGSWYDVLSMWPTKRGTYESADTSTATEIATAGTSTVAYAFVARTLSGTREYVIANSKIWEYSAGALTDRTGGVTTGTVPMMAQYGDITIGVMGAANPTVKSSGANFSALAGAPQAEIVVVQSNAVLYFNTSVSTDGWAASDVGDYTNYATGESASGRIITTPGPILAAVPFGNDIIVFKRSAIYRMTYVGGLVKWQVQLIWNGMGLYPIFSMGKYQVAACASGLVFNGAAADIGTSVNTAATLEIYLFDGASRPQKLNPLTAIPHGFSDTTGGGTKQVAPVFFYDPVEDVLCISPSMNAGGGTALPYYYYSFPMQAWGKGGGASGEFADNTFSPGNGVLQGDYYAQPATSSRPAFYVFGSTNSKLRRCVPSAPATSYSCYLQSMKVGQVDGKATFDRLIPKLRRRTDLGTDSVSLSMELFTELEDTTATTTRTVAESTLRKRFDLKGGAASETFGRFKVTWADLDVEVDDFLIKAKFVPDGN